MEDWRERRQNYLELGRRDAQPQEDMIARRIVKGLGFTRIEKSIYLLERAVLGSTYGKLPMWIRAKQVFESLLRTNYHNHTNPLAYAQQDWTPEALQIKDNAEAIARFTEWGRFTAYHAPLPLMFTRIAGTDDSLTYALWPPKDLTFLRPPFTVLPLEEAAAQLRLVVQETTLFVRQFGPFEVEIPQDDDQQPEVRNSDVS